MSEDQMRDLVKYREDIRACQYYFKDKDYILYLIFKDEFERVRDLITEINIKQIRSEANKLIGRSK